MDRLLRALGILATVALVGYAAVLLLGSPDADEAVDDTIADARRGQLDPQTAERAREYVRLAGRSAARSPDWVGGQEPLTSEEPVSAVEYGSGEVDEAGARSGFEFAMTKVEDIAESRRRLTVAEWEPLYREANDAFAALSIVLDARDEVQAAELEAAHKRLKKGLRRIRTYGPKFAH